jgi:hypothetical protein
MNTDQIRNQVNFNDMAHTDVMMSVKSLFNLEDVGCNFFGIVDNKYVARPFLEDGYVDLRDTSKLPVDYEGRVLWIIYERKPGAVDEWGLEWVTEDTLIFNSRPHTPWYHDRSSALVAVARYVSDNPYRMLSVELQNVIEPMFLSDMAKVLTPAEKKRSKERRAQKQREYQQRYRDKMASAAIPDVKAVYKAVFDAVVSTISIDPRYFTPEQIQSSAIGFLIAGGYDVEASEERVVKMILDQDRSTPHAHAISTADKSDSKLRSNGGNSLSAS